MKDKEIYYTKYLMNLFYTYQQQFCGIFCQYYRSINIARKGERKLRETETKVIYSLLVLLFPKIETKISSLKKKKIRSQIPKSTIMEKHYHGNI